MEHKPVLTKETIEALAPKPDENFIDATLGLGGHAKLILEKTAPNGRLLGIDQDKIALAKARENLERFGDRVSFFHGNFINLGLLVRDWHVRKIDGILADLGSSTYQLKSGERGFSFTKEGPLDMRMDPSRQHLTAAKIVNDFSEKELVKIFSNLGEERFARPIARKITEARRNKPIKTTFELVETVKKALPPEYRYGQKKHFATNVFRGLRMYVNDELGNLKSFLSQAAQVLSPEGRLVIISFHSLEDRMIKNFFKENERLEIITAKPITASERETIENPNARSAKLRTAKKIS